jgi:hypothetical protein
VTKVLNENVRFVIARLFSLFLLMVFVSYSLEKIMPFLSMYTDAIGEINFRNLFERYDDAWLLFFAPIAHYIHASVFICLCVMVVRPIPLSFVGYLSTGIPIGLIIGGGIFLGIVLSEGFYPFSIEYLLKWTIRGLKVGFVLAAIVAVESIFPQFFIIKDDPK